MRLPLLMLERIRVAGPGRVSIGRGCAVRPNNFQGLTIVTLSRDARVRIGPRCDLGGLTIRCRESVTLGERCMTANALIQDTLFCAPEGPRARGSVVPATGPIALGANVWLGGQTVLLPRTTLGDDCVTGWGTICFAQKAPPYTLIMGNPAGRPLPIEQVLRLKGET